MAIVINEELLARARHRQQPLLYDEPTGPISADGKEPVNNFYLAKQLENQELMSLRDQNRRLMVDNITLNQELVKRNATCNRQALRLIEFEVEPLWQFIKRRYL